MSRRPAIRRGLSVALGARYAEIQRLGQGTVTPLAFPDEAIAIEEILGPAQSASPA